MIRIGSIVLRVDDLQRQTEFWSAAFHYVPREGDSDDFVLLRSRAGEVERLKALGASEVHWSKRPPDADYVILADPEGNRFCVVDAS